MSYSHPIARLLALALLALSLSGCGVAATALDPTPPPTAPAEPAAAETATPAPPAAPAEPAAAETTPTSPPTTTAAHSDGDLNATRTPRTAAQTGGGLRAFYPCDAGLCLATLNASVARTVVADDPNRRTLRSYAISTDGTQVAYAAEKPDEAGSATIYLTDVNGTTPRQLFDVTGAESGSGGLEGYDVLGFTADGAGLIFEDRSQVFVAALDGSNRRPVLEQFLYGASSYHSYYLAPDSSRIMIVGSGAPYYLTVIDIASGATLSYTLSFDRAPVGFGASATQLVVEQSDPPLDQVEGNPATKSYMTLGYELLDLPAMSTGDAVLPAGKQVFASDGTTSWASMSNLAAGQMLVMEYERTEGDQIVDGSHALSLLDLRVGTRTPVTLPGYKLYGGVTLVAP